MASLEAPAASDILVSLEALDDLNVLIEGIWVISSEVLAALDFLAVGAWVISLGMLPIPDVLAGGLLEPVMTRFIQPKILSSIIA